jgi:sporulation protein YlmC with PRC-barrel domain
MTLSVNDLKGKRVVDKEGVDVGKIEDIELTDLKIPLTVESFIVKAGTFKKINVKVDYISKIGRDNILLNKSKYEL